MEQNKTVMELVDEVKDVIMYDLEKQECFPFTTLEVDYFTQDDLEAINFLTANLDDYADEIHTIDDVFHVLDDIKDVYKRSDLDR